MVGCCLSILFHELVVLTTWYWASQVPLNPYVQSPRAISKREKLVSENRKALYPILRFFTLTLLSSFHYPYITSDPFGHKGHKVTASRNCMIKAETPVLWPPDAKCWLIGKDSVAGRDWGQEEKGTTEDEMAGWHHWLDGRESQWTPGVDDGQGGLACCDSWGRKESDMTERLNWTELNWMISDVEHLFMC